MPETANRPGGAAAEAAAPPGAAQVRDHPPLVDLRALAFARPKHRPSWADRSVDRGPRIAPPWRAMPALSARLRVTPLRCRHGPAPRRPGQVRTERHQPVKISPGHIPREGSPRPRPPTGLLRPANRTDQTSRAAPDPTLRRTGRSNRGDVMEVVVSCTDSAFAPVVGTRSPPPPEGFGRAGSRLGWRCARRYGGHLGDGITAGQGVLSNSQGCPRNFPVTHRNRPFVHRSCTAMCTPHGGLRPP